jgi:hypothetical protein
MKKFFLCIVIALFAVTAFGALPARDSIVYAQKKGDDKGRDKERKDPPGPPVVKDKERPKNNPPKDKPKNRKPPDR